MNYEILIPRLDKNIFQLNEAEAEEYFEWFIAQIPQRVSYLTGVCAKELRISEEKLDCSPESLLLIWKWFRRRARTEKQMNVDKKQVYQGNQRQLTLETEYILRDIGMYFGETFRKNHSNIYWDYYTKPRRDFFVNHPVLKGFVDMTTGRPFQCCFEPIHYAGVQASKILSRKSSDEDLLRIYNIWAEKAENGRNAE